MTQRNDFNQYNEENLQAQDHSVNGAAAPAAQSAVDAAAAGATSATAEAQPASVAPERAAASSRRASAEERFANVQPKRRRRGGHGPGGRMMVGDKAKDFKGSMLFLFKELGSFKIAVFFVLTFALGSTVFSIIGPKVLSKATTELFEGIVAKISGTGSIDFDRIAFILLCTLALYLVAAVCQFIQGWLMASVSQKTCYNLRAKIEQKINRMPVGYFERTSTGDVLSRITNDVDQLGHSLNQGITQLVTSVATVLGVIVMMLTINPLMTLVTLIILPISLVLISVVVKASQKHFRQQQKSLGVINGLVEETFSGHAVVKAFNREETALTEFGEANEVLRGAAWKSQFLSGLMHPIMNFISNMAYVAVAIMGSIFAVQGIITVGDIQAFLQYVRNLTQPLTQLAQVSNVLQQMAAAAERIYEFLEEEELSPESEDDTVAYVPCNVEFDHVRFGYDPEVPIIKDFCATVKDGQTVALVGPTGAGKTTMVKLLMRFYDVDSGAIRIDGHDIRDCTRDDIREMYGMVLQDTWLFSGTIRDNIRYGNLQATDEEVIEAAKAAYVHHFVQTLPDGYDTVINEDASNISQGQRQLLTIARAFLANRRMLILDEATSSVDTRTEQRIQAAMDNLMRGRTSFVIAHRLSTIKNADLILVIREGDIVEQGSHDELLALGGFYAELYNSQFEEHETA